MNLSWRMVCGWKKILTFLHCWGMNLVRLNDGVDQALVWLEMHWRGKGKEE